MRILLFIALLGLSLELEAANPRVKLSKCIAAIKAVPWYLKALNTTTRGELANLLKEAKKLHRSQYSHGYLNFALRLGKLSKESSTQDALIREFLPALVELTLHNPPEGTEQSMYQLSYSFDTRLHSDLQAEFKRQITSLKRNDLTELPERFFSGKEVSSTVLDSDDNHAASLPAVETRTMTLRQATVRPAHLSETAWKARPQIRMKMIRHCFFIRVPRSTYLIDLATKTLNTTTMPRLNAE